MMITSSDMYPLNAYARGGKTEKRRRPKMELVHLNKREIHDLDSAQGKSIYDKTSGIKRYDHLAEILRNPHILKGLEEHTQQHYANGGHIELARQIEHAKRMGRHGDTELALVPHDMVEILDRLSGHKSINPHDGRHEYFLGQGFMDGMKKFFNPVGQAFQKAGQDIYNTGKSAVDTLKNKTLPAVGRGLKDIYTTATTPDATGMSPLGRGALGMATGLLTGNPLGAALSMGALAGTAGVPGTVSQGLQSAAGSYLGGADPRTAALRGFSDFSSNYDNPYGRMAQNFSQSQMRGDNMYDTMGHTAMGGLSSFDNPYARFGRGAVGEYMSSHDPYRAAAQGTMHATQGMDNPYADFARGAAETHLAGGDYRESGRQGALRALSRFQPYAQGQEEAAEA